MININKKNVERFWDAQADKIENIGDHFQSGMLEDNLFLSEFRKKMEEHNFDKLIEMESINTVLELGCGSGRWSTYLSDKAENITAVDFSNKMIELAKSSQPINSNIEYIQEKAQDYLSNKDYDLIYLSGVMQYLTDSDITAMIKNIKKMSHKDTILLTRDSVSVLKDSFHKDGEYPVIYRRLIEYSQAFEKEGFYLQNTKRSFFKPYLAVRFKLDSVIGVTGVLFIEKFVGQMVAKYKEIFDIKFRNRKKTINHMFHVYKLIE